MEHKVYVALIEVRPLPGCELDPTEVKGAIVRAYAAADSEVEAQARFVSALTEDLFAVVDVEWCVAQGEVEWERPDDEEGNAATSEALTTGEVVYGRFDVWG